MTQFIVHSGIIPWTLVSGSAWHLWPALAHQRCQLQQIRKAKQHSPLSQVLIGIASAQVGPFNGDTKERPVRALKKNPLLFLQGPSVQEDEPFSP
jgi:hypothetical protein